MTCKPCKRCEGTGVDPITQSSHDQMPICRSCKGVNGDPLKSSSTADDIHFDDVWAWIENKEEEDRFIHAMMLYDLRKYHGI